MILPTVDIGNYVGACHLVDRAGTHKIIRSEAPFPDPLLLKCRSVCQTSHCFCLQSRDGYLVDENCV